MIRTIAPKHAFVLDATVLNVFHADKGDGLPRHSHTYAHIVMCNAGAIVIRKEHKTLHLTKNVQPVNLVADEWHEIEAVDDGTVFVNIFAA